MDSRFRQHIEALHSKLGLLVAMTPHHRLTLPKAMPMSGVYLLSEGGRHLYVGRSNSIRKRLGRHCRPSAKPNMASFAFRLAREATGKLEASYRSGDGSRNGLMQEEEFATAFLLAKKRIAAMDVRFVEEVDSTRQALLEIYVAVALATPYNNFDNH